MADQPVTPVVPAPVAPAPAAPTTIIKQVEAEVSHVYAVVQAFVLAHNGAVIRKMIGDKMSLLEAEAKTFGSWIKKL